MWEWWFFFGPSLGRNKFSTQHGDCVFGALVRSGLGWLLGNHNGLPPQWLWHVQGLHQLIQKSGSLQDCVFDLKLENFHGCWSHAREFLEKDAQRYAWFPCSLERIQLMLTVLTRNLKVRPLVAILWKLWWWTRDKKHTRQKLIYAWESALGPSWHHSRLPSVALLVPRWLLREMGISGKCLFGFSWISTLISKPFHGDLAVWPCLWLAKLCIHWWKHMFGTSRTVCLRLLCTAWPHLGIIHQTWNCLQVSVEDLEDLYWQCWCCRPQTYHLNSFHPDWW